jgi:hypothetical protein
MKHAEENALNVHQTATKQRILLQSCLQKHLSGGIIEEHTTVEVESTDCSLLSKEA